MPDPRNILIVQTAFPGDVVLTLPLAQVLHRTYPNAGIDVVVIPRAAELLSHHPAVRNVIVYDKRGGDAGISGLRRMLTRLRGDSYDIAFVPHRSLRSALLVRLAGIKLRIGFHTSAGRMFLNRLVHYDKHSHEVQRNLALLRAVGVVHSEQVLPELHPSEEDRRRVDDFLASVHSGGRLIAMAPGTVWNTKRWLPDRFAELARRLSSADWEIVLLGGDEDVELCADVASAAAGRAYVAAGMLTLLQSAELLRRCAGLVCNDSAPMHLAVAVRTPVVAIFGATVPEFGFSPLGSSDIVIETKGLSCRPCSIHGGDECPIASFDCMYDISVERVYESFMRIVSSSHTQL